MRNVNVIVKIFTLLMKLKRFWYALAVFLTYERIAMLMENIKIFQHIKDLVESIIVVWNHPYYKPEAYQWPIMPFPIHVSNPMPPDCSLILCAQIYVYIRPCISDKTDPPTHLDKLRFYKICIQKCWRDQWVKTLSSNQLKIVSQVYPAFVTGIPFAMSLTLELTWPSILALMCCLMQPCADSFSQPYIHSFICSFIHSSKATTDATGAPFKGNLGGWDIYIVIITATALVNTTSSYRVLTFSRHL